MGEATEADLAVILDYRFIEIEAELATVLDHLRSVAAIA